MSDGAKNYDTFLAAAIQKLPGAFLATRVSAASAYRVRDSGRLTSVCPVPDGNEGKVRTSLRLVNRPFESGFASLVRKARGD